VRTKFFTVSVSDEGYSRDVSERTKYLTVSVSDEGYSRDVS
jgi:hypothetical protein